MVPRVGTISKALNPVAADFAVTSHDLLGDQRVVLSVSLCYLPPLREIRTCESTNSTGGLELHGATEKNPQWKFHFVQCNEECLEF